MDTTEKEEINHCRIFFYGLATISTERRSALVDLAYATARDQLLAPKAILIRSDLHMTTSHGGKHIPDPIGWHCTIAFKSEDQITRAYHVTSHGYTKGKDDFSLAQAIHSEEKPDNTPRGNPKAKRVVWPPEHELQEYEGSPVAFPRLPAK
ncbi:hypothetical protein BJY00DRAFT_315236 [Aspergillus carlsbadensis]|nr:hypothetical protein BJY00DRAFT_315236 [Aspergillus carlsbadensis]